MTHAPTCLLYIYCCPACDDFLVRDMADCQQGVPPACRQTPGCGEPRHVGTVNGATVLQDLLDDGCLDIELLDELTDAGDRIMFIKNIRCSD